MLIVKLITIIYDYGVQFKQCSKETSIREYALASTLTGKRKFVCACGDASAIITPLPENGVRVRPPVSCTQKKGPPACIRPCMFSLGPLLRLDIAIGRRKMPIMGSKQFVSV